MKKLVYSYLTHSDLSLFDQIKLAMMTLTNNMLRDKRINVANPLLSETPVESRKRLREQLGILLSVQSRGERVRQAAGRAQRQGRDEGRRVHRDAARDLFGNWQICTCEVRAKNEMCYAWL